METHPALRFVDRVGRQWHTIITAREVLHLERLLKIKILDLIDTDSETSKRLGYADRLELLLELIRPQMAVKVWKKMIVRTENGRQVRKTKRMRGVQDLEFLESLGSEEVCQAWIALYAGLVHFAQPSQETLDNLQRAATFVQTGLKEANEEAEERITAVLERAAEEISTTGWSGSSGSTPLSAESSPGDTPSASSRSRPSTELDSLATASGSPAAVCREPSPRAPQLPPDSVTGSP